MQPLGHVSIKQSDARLLRQAVASASESPFPAIKQTEG